MANITMNAKDALSASLAECYVEIDGKRYNMMSAKKVELKINKTKAKIGILGRTGKGNKSTGWEGTGSATFYFNMPIFRRALREYKDSGEDLYFDMQIVNEDPTTAVGRQIVFARDCNLDGGTLALFDVDSEVLEEELNFTFDDFEISEEFALLNGMEYGG